MGFDIYGIKPKNATPKPEVKDWSNDEQAKAYWKWQDETKGAYFRNNVWWWRPLWEYVQEVAGIERIKEFGGSNDGEVTEEEALQIAKKLRAEIKKGKTKDYEWDYTWKLVRMPDIKCKLCNGTGKRNDEHVKGECNACNGLGHERPFETNYPFSVENVKEFAEFCENSGGFEIR